ncbi:hypothetical protein EJB05_35297 [Eragrostis curvula]|uniref:Uncharacterized protein n=1 Tax=Eragrostis curvula TaxID=38414 RepID=A0A5J9U7M9_9POAL|nr:hypothetical protein EJB05_35297 [Eragrostis curvula]
MYALPQPQDRPWPHPRGCAGTQVQSQAVRLKKNGKKTKNVVLNFHGEVDDEDDGLVEDSKWISISAFSEHGEFDVFVFSWAIPASSDPVELHSV